MTSSVIITIVVVLGIIVAGGFLLYFCGDLLMGLAGKKKDADVVKEKQLQEHKELEERVSALENSEEAKKDPAIATILYDGAVVEAYDPNEEEDEEVEAVEALNEEEVSDEEAIDEEAEDATDMPIEDVEETEETEEADEEDSAEEETEENDEEDDAAEFIRQRRAELMARLARMQEEQRLAEESAEEEAEEGETVDISEDDDADEEPVEDTEEPQEPAEEPAEEPTDEEPVEEDEEDADDTEEAIVLPPVQGPLANLTLEELETRLAVEQEKLKENEKDLRQCKKEYIPLRRVKKTLESDEKKLRRKEALVAKQKVVLYGVNNYSDIDEEKAKKLAEDLDLLDGLKLSVQHCQEVMDKNEDRYPLLEKIFNLLSAQNEEIKDDIKELEEAIAKVKVDPTDTDGDTDAE